MEPRKYSVGIGIWRDGPDKTFSDKIEQFSYTDYAAGSSDAISAKVNNLDYRWMVTYALRKGDRIEVVIMHRENGVEEKFLDCGDFVVDEVGLSGRPLIGTIGAQSAPVDTNWKSKEREKSWNNTTLKQVATDVAANYALPLIYDGEEISISHVEQEKRSDSSFLSELAEKYGFAMKVYSQKIVLYQYKMYEAKDPVMQLVESDFDSWSWNTSLLDSYTGAHYSYTNSESGETYDFTIGSEERVLEVSEEADSLQDAQRITVEKLNASNRGCTTMSCSLKLPKKLVATSNIKLYGFGIMDGKYFVSQVTHSLGGSYKMTLELQKIEQRIEA